jgi:hypothetical protein
MFVENSVLPIFPDEPAAAQICAASAPLSGPTVFFVKPWTINPPDASPASAADSADFAGSADSNTAPTESKPALFRQRVPSTNFPAWPEQSIVQPMFVEKSALPILPDKPAAAQICAADSPPCWHGCRCPNVRTNSLFCQALDYPVCLDSQSADSADFADFVGAADSNTAPCVQTSIVSSALPLTILTL